jgi:hypothetical protein
MTRAGLGLTLGVLIVLVSVHRGSVSVAHAVADQLRIENARYRIVVERSGGRPTALIVSRLDQPGTSRRLTPAVRVLMTTTDPGYRAASLVEEVTLTAGWKRNAAVGHETALFAGTPGQQRQTTSSPEVDLFAVAPGKQLEAVSVSLQDARTLSFSFDAQAAYTLSLTVVLEPGMAAPIIATTVTPRTSGFYSAAFSGLAARDAAAVDFVYQPLVWSWRRFPIKSYLAPEAMATTAATFVTSGGLTEGVAADPAEIPYRFATFENSRFGLTLRDTDGRARPMLFAPVLGGAGSRLAAGEGFTFKTRYVLAAGDWYAGVQHVLRDVFAYRGERQNATLSLNDTLDNMIAFAMDDAYSGWVEELKGFDYKWDVPGTVKVVSALHALGVALVTGDREIYRRRALPLIEYVMSREKYLYATDEAITYQNPSHFLRGPCVEIGELASLFAMSGGKSIGFRREAERLFGKPRRLNLLTDTGGGTWQDALAMNRLTGERSWLDRARAGADAHIRAEVEAFPRDFRTNPALVDKQAAFYTDYGPRWFDLYDLYEATGERRYLDAALLSARAMLLMLRSHPLAPATTIVVNEGGRVLGIVDWQRVPNPKQGPGEPTWIRVPRDTTTLVPEQRIPAWRTSLVGLPPEQGRTYGMGPIMLTHHAAWLLRLAHHANDALLRDAAENAVLGRYANFPGYYFKSFQTNAYQRVDYPLHPYQDLKYNAIFYNHVWPHIALLVDYLVSDAFARSGGRVDFPSAYAPGYAYLTSKVYGHRLGRINGEDGVALWLPKRAARFSTPAVNHLFGVGASDLHLVLMNTSPEAQDVIVRLDPDVVPWSADTRYEVALAGAAGTPTSPATTTMIDGLLRVPVAAKGLTVATIRKLAVDTAFQRRVAAALPRPPSDRGFSRVDTGLPAIGTLTGMLITVVPEFADAYVYIDATEKDTQAVEFRYRLGEGEGTVVRDTAYPFELSVHVPDPSLAMEVIVEATDRRGSTHKAPSLTLAR